MEGGEAEARAAVTALVHAYATRLDAGDLEGVAALFAHAEWRSGDGNDPVLRGAAEIRTVFDRVRLYDDGTPRTTHLVGNLTIDVAGDSATSSCTFTVFQGVDPGRPIEVILTGTYHDRFERVDGTWRFALRHVRPILLGDMRRHYG